MDDELDEVTLESIDAYDPTTFPEGQYPTPTIDEPDEDELAAMMLDMTDVLATDGCVVEPDGCCPHGHPSWLAAKADQTWGAV